MEESMSVDSLLESTNSKIQQLQKAFAELESHRAITLNLKWKQIEEHFHGLQKSLKRRFTDLEEQEKEFDTKVVESKETLDKRKAAVFDQEQSSLENLQHKRDAAVSAIFTAMGKHEKPFFFVTHEETPKNALASVTTDGVKTSLEHINAQVKAYPQLVKLCQEMNSEGIHRFISENRKDLVTLKEELPIALKAASDPASLILDSLNGFYGTNVPNLDSRKDSYVLGLRRTCIMLMECLSTLFLSIGSVLISGDEKERAKAIAEEWKPKLDDLEIDASSGNSLEAHAFLQLLATFDINSDFDNELLSKLIPMVSRRRQTAELCRFLGLSDKMPGVIGILVKNGRQIDAVNLAFAFELTDQFLPIPLLKSYLSEAKTAPSSAAKPGNKSPVASVQSVVNEKELTAIKAVIKCIEDHKLEDQFPTDPLHKQVLEIEKAKADKKRATEASKPQPKRPRATNNHYSAPHATPRAVPNNAPMNKRYPQFGYERAYAYPIPVPVDRHVPSFVGPTPPYNFSPSHAGGFFGSAYGYQAAYLR